MTNTPDSVGALATLGTVDFPGKWAGRDAIHIAVFGCLAGERLFPGQHVYIGKNQTAMASGDGERIGIVDPYLINPVFPDQRVWVLLYPRTITSLRHVWTHPSFDENEASDPLAGLDALPETSPVDANVARSSRWIDNYAAGIGITYVELMEATNRYLKTGEYLSNGDQFESEYLPDEFWDHYQTVTDSTIPEEDQHSFFACSC